MGCNPCRHSATNNHHYGNIFPLILSALDREIQGLSFDAWYAAEIMRVKGCKLDGRVYKIHVTL